MRRIAVNVTDVYDMEQVNNDVASFLYADIDAFKVDFHLDRIKIDYYVCHDSVKHPITDMMFKGSRTTFSTVKNKERLFQALYNGENAEVMDRTYVLRDVLLKSYINALAIQKATQDGIYHTVISYTPELKHFKLSSPTRAFEHDFIYTPIKEYRFLKIDPALCVTNSSTFFKTVNLWQYIGRIGDWTFAPWAWYNSTDMGEYLYPLMLHSQGIKVRALHGL